MVRKFCLVCLLIFTALICLKLYLIKQPNPDLQTGSTQYTTGTTIPYSPKLPSLNEIFSDDHQWTASLSAENVRTIIATGDVMPARTVNSKVIEYNDFKWPYLKTADITGKADITLINLETPLIAGCKPTREGMVFCGDIGNIEGLLYSGTNVVNLANNHTANYGTAGVKETIKLLNQNSILVTGVSGFVVKNIKGVKFAFLGYNDISKPQPGISDVDETRIKREIAEAGNEADVVVVSFHWGTEYRDQPDTRQKYLGRLAIDSGADLVIGNHPHWIQPVEIYKGKLITYAHGNFVFDQDWSQKTREGVVGKYTFYNDKLIDVEYLPVQIDYSGQPYFLTGDKMKKILSGMKNLSERLTLTTN